MFELGTEEYLRHGIKMTPHQKDPRNDGKPDSEGMYDQTESVPLYKKETPGQTAKENKGKKKDYSSYKKVYKKLENKKPKRKSNRRSLKKEGMSYSNYRNKILINETSISQDVAALMGGAAKLLGGTFGLALASYLGWKGYKALRDHNRNVANQRQKQFEKTFPRKVESMADLITNFVSANYEIQQQDRIMAIEKLAIETAEFHIVKQAQVLGARLDSLIVGGFDDFLEKKTKEAEGQQQNQNQEQEKVQEENEKEKLKAIAQQMQNAPLDKNEFKQFFIQEFMAGEQFKKEAAAVAEEFPSIREIKIDIEPEKTKEKKEEPQNESSYINSIILQKLQETRKMFSSNSILISEKQLSDNKIRQYAKELSEDEIEFLVNTKNQWGKQEFLKAVEEKKIKEFFEDRKKKDSKSEVDERGNPSDVEIEEIEDTPVEATPPSPKEVEAVENEFEKAQEKVEKASSLLTSVEGIKKLAVARIDSIEWPAGAKMDENTSTAIAESLKNSNSTFAKQVIIKNVKGMQGASVDAYMKRDEFDMPEDETKSIFGVLYGSDGAAGEYADDFKRFQSCMSGQKCILVPASAVSKKSKNTELKKDLEKQLHGIFNDLKKVDESGASEKEKAEKTKHLLSRQKGIEGALKKLAEGDKKSVVDMLSGVVSGEDVGEWKSNVMQNLVMSFVEKLPGGKALSDAMAAPVRSD